MCGKKFWSNIYTWQKKIKFFVYFNYFLYMAINVLESILKRFKSFLGFCHMEISKTLESPANAFSLYFRSFSLFI